MTKEIKENKDYHKMANDVLEDIKKLYPEIKGFFVGNLYLRDHDLIDIIFATALSKAFPDEPIWLGIIAPPSSGKTEILRSFGENVTNSVYPSSKLTENSLASGSGDMQTMLASELDGKLWIIKDGTTLLQGRNPEIIFSHMREMYDGYMSVDSGQKGGTKRGKTRTTLLFGVTPYIDRTKIFKTSLGERFIYFRTPIVGDDEEGDKIYYDMVINSFLNNTRKRSYIEEKVTRFMKNVDLLGGCLLCVEINRNNIIDERTSKLIFQIAKLVAQMRVDVDWDYREHDIRDVGEEEGPGRLMLQLLKLAMCIKIIRGKKSFENEDIITLIKVGLDSIPRKRMVPLSILIRQYNTYDKVNRVMGNAEIVSYMKNEHNISWPTANRYLQELEIIKVISNDKSGGTGGNDWIIHPRFYEKYKHIFDYMKDIPQYNEYNVIDIPGSEHNPVSEKKSESIKKQSIKEELDEKAKNSIDAIDSE